MKKISTELVEDGMVALRDICGPSGNTLVNKGAVLSAALGRRLANWGIPFVYIEGEEEVKAQEAVKDVTHDALKAQLMAKFSNCIDNPIMKKIFVAAYQYRTQNND
jgi:hypothetical protein